MTEEVKSDARYSISHMSGASYKILVGDKHFATVACRDATELKALVTLANVALNQDLKVPA